MKVTSYRVLSITPTVRREDGQAITDEDKGLALLYSLRNLSTHPCSLASLGLTMSMLVDYDQAELLHVQIGDEVVCSIPLTP